MQFHESCAFVWDGPPNAHLGPKGARHSNSPGEAEVLVGRADSSFDFRVRLKGKRRGELKLNGGSPIYDDVVFPRGRGYASTG